VISVKTARGSHEPWAGRPRHTAIGDAEVMQRLRRVTGRGLMWGQNAPGVPGQAPARP
jgi:hypothetical protein